MPGLLDLLGGDGPTFKIVDVGAMELGAPPYQALLALPCTVIGFEPNPAECAKLNANAPPSRVYVPHFVGDGARRTFHWCSWAATSSLYPPNTPLLERFSDLARLVQVASTSQVDTTRLDDIAEVSGSDFVKIDVQGATLDVLRGGPRTLEGALVVQLEAELVPLYEGEPLFAEIDLEMRRLGYLFHRFASLSPGTFAPLRHRPERNNAQLLWTDAVYVRSFMRLGALSPEQLVKTALILELVYDSRDLALHILQHHDARTGGDLGKRYLELLTSPGLYLTGAPFQLSASATGATQAGPKLGAAASPPDAEALNARGTTLVQAGALDAAEQVYLQSIALDPRLYKPHANLANLHTRRGHHAEAADCLQRALTLEPRAARLWIRLGQSFDRMQREAEANQAYERGLGLHLADRPDADVAAELAPELALRLLPVALQAGRLPTALQLVRHARTETSSDAALVRVEAACLEAVGRRPEAVQLLESAFAASPSLELAAALAELAARGDKSHVPRALGVLATARARNPRSAELLTAAGLLAQADGDPAAALAAFEAALEIDPHHARATLGLGVAESTLAPSKRAIAFLERAVRLEPLDPTALSALLVTELRAGLWSSERRLQEHRRYAARFAMVDRLARRQPPAPLDDRRLRVGYLVTDLHDRGACFLRSILRHHDRGSVELFLYGTQATIDELSSRGGPLDLDQRDVGALGDAAAAQRIADDRLDVLVAIDGLVGAARARLLQRRVAPVQVSYLGHPPTLALDSVDHRIGDAIADPPGPQERHDERVVRLPHSAWCYAAGFEGSSAREAAGAAIVFGCFQPAGALSEQLLAAIARVLERVPGSRLSLDSPAGGELTRRRIAAALGDAVSSRVDFMPPDASEDGRWARYRQVDVALDTFPCNGSSSTCDALWMGVPVVTLAGATHTERVGASLLEEVGLADCVATDVDGYVERAALLADDASRRASLRAALRERMRASTLVDAARFTRSLEQALLAVARSPRPDEPPPELLDRARPVHTEIGSTLFLPDALSVISTFVFLEQRRWFEQEVPFLRALARAGDVIADVGANLGAYAIDLAARVGPTGRVVAFEPASITAAMLSASAVRLGLRNVTVHQVALGEQEGEATLQLGPSPELSQIGAGDGPSERVSVRPLCAFADELRGVSFVKLDAEGSESAILRGSPEVFVDHEPLVMFELRHGELVNLGLIDEFKALGFEVFQLCPGLEALVPFDPAQIDPFLLNLFAARPARAEQLEQRGLCLRRLAQAAPEPADDEAVARWIAGSALLSSLGSSVRAERAGVALRLLIGAHERGSPLGARHAALRAAFAAAREGSLWQRFTAARAARDLGLRASCLALVQPVKDAALDAVDATLEPFACPIDRYAREAFESWEVTLRAQALELEVKLGAHSGFYQPASVLGLLRRFFAAGGVDEEMDRRLGLVLARRSAGY